MVGMMLVGLFAAMISKSDSQVLSGLAGRTEDLFTSADRKRPYWTAKLGTLVVTACALVTALFRYAAERTRVRRPADLRPQVERVGLRRHVREWVASAACYARYRRVSR